MGDNAQDISHVQEIDGEEFASIIDSESSAVNVSAFQRYAVPPQFDGNSSEEENAPKIEEKQTEVAEDGDDEEINDAGYAPLIADEFGEFVSSEDFDYHSPGRVGYLQELVSLEPDPSSEAVEPVTGDSNSEASSIRVSIAPLDAGKCWNLCCQSTPYDSSILTFLCTNFITLLHTAKIQTIKAAMSKITIKQPNSGAGAYE